jgi:deoxyribodipyrimidine photo-lyase
MGNLQSFGSEEIRALVESPRVTIRRDAAPDPNGRCVVYWMQRAQRGINNHAIDLALQIANLLGLPLIVTLPDSPTSLTRIYGIMPS